MPVTIPPSNEEVIVQFSGVNCSGVGVIESAFVTTNASGNQNWDSGVSGRIGGWTNAGTDGQGPEVDASGDLTVSTVDGTTTVANAFFMYDD